MSDEASSYRSLIYQLAQDVATLALHGKALRQMGELAPPCLVQPYREYVAKVQAAIGETVVAFSRENGDAAGAELEEQIGALLLQASELPVVTQSYTGAPPCWQPEAYESPGHGEGSVETPPMGKPMGLGQVVDEILRCQRLLMEVDRGVVAGAPAVVKATEAVGASRFWRGMLTSGRSLLSWGRKWFPEILLFEAGRGGITGAVAAMAEGLSRQPASVSVRSAVEETIKSFEEDYWPRVAQQWQAMIRIYRTSMGNPDLVRVMMDAWDPQKMEKPLPPKKGDYDVFSLGDLLGVETYKPRHQWVAIPILVGGCIGAEYVVGD